MELAAVFILSILGGYAFATSWWHSRHQTRHHDGQHVYLRSALYGAYLFAFALAIRLLLLRFCPGYPSMESFVSALIEPLMKEHDPAVAAIVITAVYSLVLGAP
jgi:hypothetical protein